MILLLFFSCFFLEIKFYYHVFKKVVIFPHNNFKSKMFSREYWYLIFIVELHFNLTITPLTSVVQRGLLIMMFPMHQALVMTKSTHVVGFLNWKNGMSTIIAVQMSYSPTDNSYLSLKQLSVIFVIKIVFLQWI